MSKKFDVVGSYLRPESLKKAREDFEATGYFKMVMKIYNSVPEALKEKVVILPREESC